MNPIKLALLINDSKDALEKSVFKGLYVLDEKGEIKRDANGFPFYDMIATTVLNTIIQAQIISETIKHESQ